MFPHITALLFYLLFYPYYLVTFMASYMYSLLLIHTVYHSHFIFVFYHQLISVFEKIVIDFTYVNTQKFCRKFLRLIQFQS